MNDKRNFLVSYKMRKYLMIKLINDIVFYDLLFEDINIETQEEVSMVSNDSSNFSFNDNITTKEEAVFIALISSIIFFNEKEFNIEISNVADALSPISYNISFEEKEYNIDMSRVIKALSPITFNIGLDEKEWDIDISNVADALSPITFNIGLDEKEWDIDTHVDFLLNILENIILDARDDISVKTKNKMDSLEGITFKVNDNIKTYGEWLFTLNEITTTKAITNVLFTCSSGARSFGATSFNIDNNLQSQLKGSTSLSLYKVYKLYDYDDLELNKIDNSSLSVLNEGFL